MEQMLELNDSQEASFIFLKKLDYLLGITNGEVKKELQCMRELLVKFF